MLKNDDFWTPPRCPLKLEKSIQFSFQDVLAVTRPLLLDSGGPRASPFSRTGSSGKRYEERRDKLREKIQGKKRDLTRPRPEAQRIFTCSILFGSAGRAEPYTSAAPVLRGARGVSDTQSDVCQILSPITA